jgi:hypothetical protein
VEACLDVRTKCDLGGPKLRGREKRLRDGRSYEQLGDRGSHDVGRRLQCSGIGSVGAVELQNGRCFSWENIGLHIWQGFPASSVEGWLICISAFLFFVVFHLLRTIDLPNSLEQSASASRRSRGQMTPNWRAGPREMMILAFYGDITLTAAARL